MRGGCCRVVLRPHAGSPEPDERLAPRVGSGRLHPGEQVVCERRELVVVAGLHERLQDDLVHLDG